MESVKLDIIYSNGKPAALSMSEEQHKAVMQMVQAHKNESRFTPNTVVIPQPKPKPEKPTHPELKRIERRKKRGGR